MKKVSQDTWQTDINYNSDFKGYTCNNCVSNTGIIHIGETLITTGARQLLSISVTQWLWVFL